MTEFEFATELRGGESFPSAWGAPPKDAAARAEWIARCVRGSTGGEVRALPPDVERVPGVGPGRGARGRDPRLLALDLRAKDKPLRLIVSGTPRLDHARRRLELQARGSEAMEALLR